MILMILDPVKTGLTLATTKYSLAANNQHPGVSVICVVTLFKMKVLLVTI